VDLTYLIEFGDGHRSDAVKAIHAFTIYPAWLMSATARVTVTDRFGRTSVARRDFAVVSLEAAVAGYNYWREVSGPEPSQGPYRNGGLTIVSHAGRELVGYYFPEGSGGIDHTVRVSGNVAGERDVRLVLADGTPLDGVVMAEWRNRR
jgi:hypothetical protein